MKNTQKKKSKETLEIYPNSKYSPEIAEKVFRLMESDEYTQREICSLIGIHEDTFTNWKNRHSEFSEGIKKAKEKLIEKRLVQCKRSLVKLINGYTYTETVTEYVDDGEGKAKIRAQRETTKNVAPSLGAIIHYQTNTDPEHWQNKQRLEHTGKDGDELQLRPLTQEEIDFLSKQTE